MCAKASVEYMSDAGELFDVLFYSEFHRATVYCVSERGILTKYKVIVVQSVCGPFLESNVAF